MAAGSRRRSWLRPGSGRDQSDRASGDVVVIRQLSARRSAHRHQLQGRRRELDEQPDTKKHGRADRDVAQDVQQVMHRFLLDRPFHGSLAGGWHAGPAPAPLRLRTSGHPSGATARIAIALGEEALLENESWAQFRRERGMDEPVNPFRRPW